MIPYYVYIVECADKTLYTGITPDIQKRIVAHNSKKSGAKYTRSRRPVNLRYIEKVENKQTALKIEHHLKKMSRANKLKIINKQLDK